jgi:hypothetical protein
MGGQGSEGCRVQRLHQYSRAKGQGEGCVGMAALSLLHGLVNHVVNTQSCTAVQLYITNRQVQGPLPMAA